MCDDNGQPHTILPGSQVLRFIIPTCVQDDPALGADLGGSATAVGASGVVIGLVARAGHPITFWQFTKYGSVIAAVTIAVSWLYLWLRYYAFG